MPTFRLLSRPHRKDRVGRRPKATAAVAPAAAAAAVVVLLALFCASAGGACTNLIVTPGASADGSTIVTYTCDGEFHPILRRSSAADHGPDDVVEIRSWSGELQGTIPQVPHTFAVVNLMNEYQVTIGETTFDGRLELQDPDGLVHYWWLMRLALERAGTAREAIEVMAALVAEHGYASTGETFSIADPDEAWIMEMIGRGPSGDHPERKGAVWVARRIPDGMICAHANLARIHTFPLEDPENCLYSPDVVDFAVDQGFFDPRGGRPFSFREAYCPATPQTLRYTATRVWSLFRRAAPSQDWPEDYHRGVAGAEPYPLWTEPDARLSVNDVFALMRDHYEGTPYDMTEGVDAGPFGCPVRVQPMGWEVDGEKFTWERPISTKKTGFSMVSQSRRWLPDAVGGLQWYGVDDTAVTCYVPLYCGIDALPQSFATGSLQGYSDESAWWVFNLVGNYANLRYRDMIQDIQTVQHELEGHFLALQPAVEQTAVALAKTDPELLRRYLTDYSVQQAELTVDRWRALGKHLITKYNDGYVKDDRGRPQEVGYPETWLRDVLKVRPDQFRLPETQTDSLQTELPY
ncbi:MAG: C69 family dipeptidase [Candidatus Krumholzibacteriia bacterium]